MRQEAEAFSSELPSETQLFMIGRNSRGNWVVRDQFGLRGGLFINRAEALRFALFENGRRLQAVLMVPGTLELDLDRMAGTEPKAKTKLPRQLERKVA
jgi:hypothetical protein